MIYCTCEANGIEMPSRHAKDCPMSAPLPVAAHGQSPIHLNEEQEHSVKAWAADDRLWTTQETVEINLRTFARVILRDAAESAPLPVEGAQELVAKWRARAREAERYGDNNTAGALDECADALETVAGGAAAPLPFAAPPLECACGGANDHCDGTCSYESAPLAAEAGLADELVDVAKGLHDCLSHGQYRYQDDCRFCAVRKALMDAAAVQREQAQTIQRLDKIQRENAENAAMWAGRALKAEAEVQRLEQELRDIYQRYPKS
jgi:hypothetical protein